jgi:hypothetical protein
MMRNIAFMVSAAMLAACGQSEGDAPANQAAKAPPKERPAYCFFKDAETKAWAASRDKDGNIVVKGKLFRSDPRYKALLGSAKVSGSTAEIAPTIAQNDTGYAAPENWWEVTATIPDSAAVGTVKVNCGAKTLAELTVALNS